MKRYVLGMKGNSKAFTIIETLIAIALLSFVIGSAFKVKNDALNVQKFGEHRIYLLLALSAIKDETLNKKDFYLSDKLKVDYKDMDDRVRRLTKERYHYTKELYKNVKMGDEVKSIEVRVEKVKVSLPRFGGMSMYKLSIQ